MGYEHKSAGENDVSFLFFFLFSVKYNPEVSIVQFAAQYALNIVTIHFFDRFMRFWNRKASKDVQNKCHRFFGEHLMHTR